MFALACCRLSDKGDDAKKSEQEETGGGVGWGSLLTHSPFFSTFTTPLLSLATLHNLNAMENIRESPFLLNDHDFLFFLILTYSPLEILPIKGMVGG